MAQGKVCHYNLAPTRKEKDFLNHIASAIALDPSEEWIFIVDRLNTHQSESLVRFVAKECQIPEELGVKGKSGILRSMSSRATFLSHPSHRIRFVYLPKHTSWLNQIECWFSILVRRLLKRGNFTSTNDLQRQIEQFIAYFNRTLAKPFVWNFKGFEEAKCTG